MDELVRMVSERAGIPEDTARAAAEAVLRFLKERLPAPIAGQIDALLEGSGSSGQIGDIAKGIGSILGRQ